MAGLAFADSDANRFALVMGNSAYSAEAALANPCNDASDVADALTSIGWKVTKVLNSDRRVMNKAVDEFHDTLLGTPNSIALLFYAGHGIQLAGQNYLIPVKETFENASDVTHDAVSLQSILDAFADAKVSTTVIILDACRDNPFLKKSSRSLGAARGLTVVNKSDDAEGSAILFSTAPGETAQDGTGRNGVFTQALLKFIKSDIPLQLLTGRVAGEVRKLTGGIQVPYSSLSLSDDFYLVPASLRMPAAPATPHSVPVLAPPSPPAPGADSSAVKANLAIEKRTLQKKKQAVQSERGWVGWLGGTGWALASLGAGLSGYSFWSGTEALTAYNGAVTASDYSSARDRVNSMNVLFKVGLVVGGAGVVAGVASLFLGPDTASLDKQIKEVDQKITLLGGSGE